MINRSGYWLWFFPILLINSKLLHVSEINIRRKGKMYKKHVEDLTKQAIAFLINKTRMNVCLKIGDE